MYVRKGGKCSTVDTFILNLVGKDYLANLCWNGMEFHRGRTDPFARINEVDDTDDTAPPRVSVDSAPAASPRRGG